MKLQMAWRLSAFWRRRLSAFGVAGLLICLVSCARTGRLEYVANPVTPVSTDSTQTQQPATPVTPLPWVPLFGDTSKGFVAGTGDSTRRFLGSLRQGFTADTLNIILMGDNRPAYRSTRLKPDLLKVQGMISWNPINFLDGLIHIPIVLVKGLIPDLALVRDVPDLIKKNPSWGREESVVKAVIAKIDSIEANHQTVAAVINTGDLVKDGRYPHMWERFLRITKPLYERVPYFPIAGNHERTDTEQGLENWRTATGLPISGDRLYYSFDSADGWVRFLALDSNPMTDPHNYWTREVEVQYSDEQIDWLTKSLKGHPGPCFVFMHHPPFSSGFHRVEWQNDDVLRERRERMVKAMREGGIGVLATGHEHAYERAILTWPDAVLISIVAGGAGSPLHTIPPPKQSAALYSEYKVAGSVVKPENVFTAEVYHFVHVRLWFGGGEILTYAVDQNAKTTLIDTVEIDLKRYGTPKIDQYKRIIPPEGPEQPPPVEESKDKKDVIASSDSTKASERLESEPAPGEQKTQPPKKTTPSKKSGTKP